MLIFILGSLFSIGIGAIIIFAVTKLFSGTQQIIIHYLGVGIILIGMIVSFVIPLFLPKDNEKYYTETKRIELSYLENEIYLLYQNDKYYFKTINKSESISAKDISVIVIESVGCKKPIVEIQLQDYHSEIWEYETKPIIKKYIFYIPLNSFDKN